MMDAVIHEVWGDEAELVRAAVEWAAQRVVRPTDSKRTARAAAELAAAAGRTVTRGGDRGHRGAARLSRRPPPGDALAGRSDESRLYPVGAVARRRGLRPRYQRGERV